MHIQTLVDKGISVYLVHWWHNPLDLDIPVLCVLFYTSKVTFTGSSMLCSVWRIHLRGGTMYSLFVRIRGATMRVEKK